ncbi:MAG: hypothetical protein LUH54_01990 [Firmicutes bacterium]|nr:hypothetical protein [Bacillota bacterium]
MRKHKEKLYKAPLLCSKSTEFISLFLFLSGYFALISGLALIITLDDAYDILINIVYIFELLESSLLSAMLAVGGGLLIDLLEQERKVNFK